MYLSKRFSKILIFFWPPCEVYEVNAENQKELNQFVYCTPDERKKKIWEKIAPWYEKLKTIKIVQDWIVKKAIEISNSELQRRAVLENKANSLLIATGLGISILSIVPVIFGKLWDFPVTLSIIVGLSFTIAVIYLVFGAYYAIWVTKVGPIFIEDTSSMDDIINFNGEKILRSVAEIIANTELNYKCSLIKSNNLLVAQKLFIRGLIAVVIGATITCSILIGNSLLN